MTAEEIIRKQLGLTDNRCYQRIDIEDIEIIMEAYNAQVLEDIKKEIKKVRDKRDVHPIISKQICEPYEEALSIIDKHIKNNHE